VVYAWPPERKKQRNMTVQKGGGPNKYSKYSFLIIVLLSVLVLSYAIRNPLGQEQQKLTYSEFLDKLESKQVTEVVIANQGTVVRGKLTGGKEFITDAPEDKDLVQKLEDAGVEFSAENPGMKENITSFLTVIIVPAAIILVFWLLIMRQAQVGGSQAMNFGRSKAKVLTENMPEVTFDDVAGVDEAKDELVEIVDFLKDPGKFQKLGAKIPKGVLLVGAPGTGKTLLARAISGEAGVPFLHMSGSDFVEMFVGVGASRVRDLFEQAKKNAPCLVFVDEIDAVGRQRGAGLGGGHDEREQTLNQLLVEMDGFDPNIGVILIAATNRPDVLDPALLRPGRFDRRVIVDRPDLNGRKAILEVHSKGKPLDYSVDLEVIARRTPGFTGADLENVMNESAILAAREDAKVIDMSHLEEAIDRVMAGPERKSRLLSEKERRNTAFHETGHALVAKLLPDTDPVHKISILPRGMALGYTLQLPFEDKYSKLKTDLLNDICVFLGGRVAERLVLGEISTGASNDLERATKLARRMVMQFGMSDELGPLTFGKSHEDAVFLGRDLATERNYSEEIAAKIDEEVKKIVDECYQKAKKLLEENSDRLHLVAEKLIKHETLEGVRLETLLEGKDLPDGEIERLEKERKEKIEEETRKRKEEQAKKGKEQEEKLRAERENEENELDDPGDDGDQDGGEVVRTVEGREEETGPGDEPDGEDAEEAQDAAGRLGKSGALLTDFYNLLEATFKETFSPAIKMTGNADERLVRIEKDGDPADSGWMVEELRDAIAGSGDPKTRAGLHLRLALLHAQLHRADLVADELMNALHAGSGVVGSKVEGILISSISYFRIINEELRKNRLNFENLMSESEILENIDRKYIEWEKKAAEASSLFFPMDLDLDWSDR